MSAKPIHGRTIRCILFDLGDTLWSRKDVPAWREVEVAANRRAVALLRTHIAPHLLPPLGDDALGERLRESLDEYIRSLKRWNPEVEANGPVAVTLTLQRLGIEKVDLALGTAIYEALRVRIPESRPLFSDTLSTLAVLQQRGYLLGIVTNRLYGGESFQEDLRELGLLDYFHRSHMAISGDLGIRKPNPAIFLHTLKSFAIAPEHAAMVGDSLHADILGAQKLGILAIWKPKVRQLPRVKTYLAAHGTTIPTYGTVKVSSSPGLPLEDPSADVQTPDLLPPGLHNIDDDSIGPEGQSRRGYFEQYLRGEIRPDLIMERLSDLLEVFPEVSAS